MKANSSKVWQYREKLSPVANAAFGSASCNLSLFFDSDNTDFENYYWKTYLFNLDFISDIEHFNTDEKIELDFYIREHAREIC